MIKVLPPLPNLTIFEGYIPSCQYGTILIKDVRTFGSLLSENDILSARIEFLN